MKRERKCDRQRAVEGLGLEPSIIVRPTLFDLDSFCFRLWPFVFIQPLFVLLSKVSLFLSKRDAADARPLSSYKEMIFYDCRKWERIALDYMP